MRPAGTQRVHADAQLRVLDGGRLGEADHAVFARGVRRVAGGAADQPERRRIVHDRAAPVLEHFRDLVLHAQEDAFQVDRHDGVPVGFGVLCRENQCVAADAGVVERAVELSPGCDGSRDHRLDLARLRDIRLDEHRVASDGTDLQHRRLALGGTARDHGHARAFLRELDRRSLTDAGARAGDDCYLAFESLVHRLPRAVERIFAEGERSTQSHRRRRARQSRFAYAMLAVSRRRACACVQLARCAKSAT